MKCIRRPMLIDFFKNLETGKISEENFYNELNKRTGLYLPTNEIESAWNAMLLSFREESLDFLDAIKTKVSNFFY